MKPNKKRPSHRDRSPPSDDSEDERPRKKSNHPPPKSGSRPSSTKSGGLSSRGSGGGQGARPLGSSKGKRYYLPSPHTSSPIPFALWRRAGEHALTPPTIASLFEKPLFGLSPSAAAHGMRKMLLTTVSGCGRTHGTWCQRKYLQRCQQRIWKQRPAVIGFQRSGRRGFSDRQKRHRLHPLGRMWNLQLGPRSVCPFGPMRPLKSVTRLSDGRVAMRIRLDQIENLDLWVSRM